MNKKQLIKIIIALILFVTAICLKFNNELINKILFIASYIIVGSDVLKEAIENIFKGEVFDENFLMTVATIGAFIIGEWPEAVCVMLFYQIGEFFEDYAVDHSKKSIANLMDVRPDFANVIRNGEQIKVNPNEVKIDEIIIVKPGEKIPLDGIVIEGNTNLDTKALTGESLPKQVIINEQILSGCINLTNVIKIKVTKEYEESTVNKILDLVENASEKKAKSENFITKFAKYYTPTVVIISIFLAIIPSFVLKIGTFSEWIYRALSFLVVSCPCALVISIPLSFFGGIGGASKKGILIKGGNYLEALSCLETVVFDKTGTLTKGVFEIEHAKSENISNDKLLEIAAYSEYYSNHPISLSIKQTYKKEIDENKIEKIEEKPGYGIIAKIWGKDILVGNEKLMEENNIKFEKCKTIGTTLYIAENSEYMGHITIADKIKDDAKNTIERLKKIGIKQTIMLTGDKKSVGEYVAKELRMDKVYTELLPNEKVDKVEEMLKTKSKNRKLAFIGDGINDAPVLAMSDIGIAMGGLGSDAAIEAADIVIMTDELPKIVSSIKIARKTMRIVKENIVFAIIVKILVLILSAIGIATMWEAVFADVGVTIIAIINSFRLLKRN